MTHGFDGILTYCWNMHNFQRYAALSVSREYLVIALPFSRLLLLPADRQWLGKLQIWEPMTQSVVL